MKKVALFLLLVELFVQAKGQTYMELVDNMEIPSNSDIKILGGDYIFTDYEWDGVIKIINKENIIIDGDSVTVQGGNFMGYMIDIQNSTNIVLRNFELVNSYKYAVRCLNSQNILIEANNFSYNKKDTTGWIQIWTPYTSALGGGVLFYNSSFIEVHENVMTQQNDGVALYQCNNAVIANNVMNWNCGFGVRLNFSDFCWVHHNDLSHINRETDPSDCAAILLIVSNNNLVEHNNLSYSGDGVFLGQFEYSQIPNNNEFYYNECSFSPHNAIEATFADGNIYKHNKCNYSHYGFWLGYSFNSMVDSNEVIGNQHSGIAIDRGFNNSFTGNIISENPAGLELWEGDGIPPYQNQLSQDYYVLYNMFEGNEKAILAKKTEHLVVAGNQFLNNRTDIYLEGDSFNDTITGNLFQGTATFYIENRSSDDIYAVANDFVWNDTDLISCKVYDQEDDPAFGQVMWQPFLSGIDPYYQHIPPTDMAEPEAIWYAYPEACWGYGNWIPTFVEWDYNNKVFGEASIHLVTGNGWDLGMMYRPGDGAIASWNLTEHDTLVIWARSINTTGYGFQFCHVKLGNNCGGYYRYTASAAVVLNPTINQWKEIRIPLAGGSPWARSMVGSVELSNISYIEFHADTWEYGFELWLDGVNFVPNVTTIKDPNRPCDHRMTISPNPVKEESIISLSLPHPECIEIDLIDYSGSFVKVIRKGSFDRGQHTLIFRKEDLGSGIYLIRFKSENAVKTQKIIIL
ncbi:MAG: right-handed parallel beta-helix repeat-containing protein [Bacteroidales bacterium]|nr:right-handed parallel beta-helix repeat-containing protein [Bacteroidales bacterium]